MSGVICKQILDETAEVFNKISWVKDNWQFLSNIFLEKIQSIIKLKNYRKLSLKGNVRVIPLVNRVTES